MGFFSKIGSGLKSIGKSIGSAVNTVANKAVGVVKTVANKAASKQGYQAKTNYHPRPSGFDRFSKQF
jgi:hypothetical protein